MKTQKCTVIVGIASLIAAFGILCAACDNPADPTSTTPQKKLVSIAVTTPPDKTQYNLNETPLDTAGMVVTATYDDGSKEAITGYALSGFSSATTGNKTITASYSGQTTTFTINVIDPNKPTVATPTATPPASEVASGTTVSLNCQTTDAEIWYTTDGVTVPAKNGAGSTKYTAPIAITAATTIKAIAVKDGMNDSGIMEVAYTITTVVPNTVAKPTATPPAGEVISGATISLNCETADAEIWYTTDGVTVPAKNGTGSTKYTAPIAITAAMTIKAIAVKDGMNDSGIITETYTIMLPKDAIAIYSSGASGIACYWNGSEKTDLSVPGGTDRSFASAIVVENGIVYTAGFYDPDNNWHEKACYWKGTERIDLSAGIGSSMVNAITVVNGEVYTAGYYRDDSGGNFIPCYWRDTTRIDFSVGEGFSAITVENGTVYMAGSYEDTKNGVTRNRACYWNGTTRIALPGPDNSDPYSSITGNGASSASVITVENGVVYTAGIYNDNGTMRVCYWVDTDRVDIDTPAEHGMLEISAITVVDGEVYIAGYYQDRENFTMRACYWKGTERIDLPGGDGEFYAHAITVVDEEVYTSGACYDWANNIKKAYYWKGTEGIDMGVIDGQIQASFIVVE